MKGLILSVFSAVFVFCLTTAAVLPDNADLAKREYAPLADVLRDLYASDNSMDKRKGWGGCQDDRMDWISFQHCMIKRAAAVARFRRDLQNL